MMRPAPSFVCAFVALAFALCAIVPAAAQFNVDSVKQLLTKTPEPIAHLKLLRQLSKAADPEVQRTYAWATIHYADSLLAHGHKGDFTVLTQKGGGMWNVGTQYHRYGRVDSANVWFRKAAAHWKAIGDKERTAFANSYLANIMLTEGDVQEAIQLLEETRAIHETLHDTLLLSEDHATLGRIYVALGDYHEAIDHLHKALRFAEQADSGFHGAPILFSLGDIYAEQGDADTAMVYYERAVSAWERSPWPQGAYMAFNDMSDILIKQGAFPEALEMCHKGLALLDSGYYVDESAILYRSMSIIYLAIRDLDQAIVYGEKAVSLYTEAASVPGLIGALISLAQVWEDKGNPRKALALATEARALAGSTTISMTMRRDLAMVLAEVHTNLGSTEKGFEYYREFIAIKDSIANDENRKHAMRSQFQYAYDKKQAVAEEEQKRKDALALAELQRQKLLRNGTLAGLGVVAGFLLLVFVQRNKIRRERDRSDTLLLNILPEEVAEELKAKGAAEAVQIDQVTVLFTDFKGFTAMSEKLTAKELVADIHECFSAFDRIMEKYGIEKIKTIGDAYMAAGGLPTPNTTHALDVVKAALEIRDFIAEGKVQKMASGLPYFEIRIGIHTGPVVAGIVGVKKFQYDIWGDTVNTASRMESSGEVGQVNISEATCALVANDPDLVFTPRGKVQAKGKGEMEMYFVERATQLPA